MVKPDFIIPGFQKSGTTAIYFTLKSHFSDIVYLANNNQSNATTSLEPNFFAPPNSENSNLGKDWYFSLFNKNAVINGEKSPSYLQTYRYTVPEIKRVLPDIKLLISMRNPTTRAFSAYNHYTQKYPESKKWGEWDHTKNFYGNFFSKDNVFKEMGIYWKPIDLILSLFSRNNLCFVIQERLIDPNKYQSEWSKIINFLDLPKRRIELKSHHSRKYNYQMPEKTKLKVNEFYEEHNEKLFNLLGYEIDEWRV